MKRIPVLCLLGILCLFSHSASANVTRRHALLDKHSTWMQFRSRSNVLQSRSLFGYALQLCENNVYLERLDELFALAASMQDRRAESPTCGNFRWSLKDGSVLDPNAVDFCMENGAIIWLRHRDRLTHKQRQQLHEIMQLAMAACMKRQIPASYTNIAIMNFQNLILLGEMFERQDVLDAGKKRLDDFLTHTALNGISEYASPTYAGVDLECLHRLHQFTTSPDVRDKTERLLNLFWADIAAVTFPPSHRLAGPHSRDYDYLRGFGLIDPFLHGAGLAEPPEVRQAQSPHIWRLSTWRPAENITALARLTPRFVQQVWGSHKEQDRSFWAGRNIALGIAGACYHNMDIPLAINFAADNPIPRGYFIADGRRDPYGKKVIPEGGAHFKTLHLKPFWAGTQRQQDALGLVVYRLRDIDPANPTLESHVVLPHQVDEILVNDTPVVCKAGQPFTLPLNPGDALFVRSRAGAVGIRVPWTRAIDGKAAPVAIVWDNNAHGAFRLTVAHHDFWGAPPRLDALPGAAFWVRVCDQADTPQAFRAFRDAFRRATPTVAVQAGGTIALEVPGQAGSLQLVTAPPFHSLVKRVPQAKERPVLAVNGHDLGKQLLGDIPGVRAYLEKQEQLRQYVQKNEIAVRAHEPVIWNAAKSVVLTPTMTLGQAPDADGGQFVWTPGKPGCGGGGLGTATWQINVLEQGTYYLWAHASTPTQEDDSFRLSIRDLDENIIHPHSDWHLGITGGPWQWKPYPLGGPHPLQLKPGRYLLTLHTREDGAKIDMLALTPTPTQP